MRTITLESFDDCGVTFVAMNQDQRVLCSTTDVGYGFLARAFGWAGNYTQADIRACGGNEPRAYERAAHRWLDAHEGRRVENVAEFVRFIEVTL